MSTLQSLLNKPDHPIAPLFWQHGESESTLRQEIQQMHSKGIQAFIVESRPHPDFLGERWWHDLDAILDEARKRSMQVWIFDDKTFPSGFSAGLIKEAHPEYLKVYLAERHIDAIGPLPGASFFINAWLEPGERLVRLIAARRLDRVDRLDEDTLLDLTGQVVDGSLYWDVPVGDWRLFILICTRNGGEDWTKDYLNPLVPEAVQAYLDFVYEPHFRRYAAEFGRTIAGFFSDEPRFGNASSYEASIGRYPMVLPYAPDLLLQLNQAWGSDFGLFLPCLWYEGGPRTHGVRYTYMDVVSRSFSLYFSHKIGAWCRAHGVRLIGHIIEDNGAHARLGYGPGHFFRAIAGQDMSGMDLVYQVWPAFTSGRQTTPFGYLDCDFFYWGIAKLASSAGHIDPLKGGRTACEVFGAYGWQEGLKLMKWLTDFICVRGINFIIPHAFSPKANDPDCPPHFYARGLNPQWKYFQHWSGYASRLCRLLSGGRHIAPLAVLYHAEAEWSGEYEPFEKVVKTLALQQIDCDVLPMDMLVDPASLHVELASFRVNGETYRALVVPYAERLPGPLIQALAELAEACLPILFLRDYPQAASLDSPEYASWLERLKRNPHSQVCTHANLAQQIRDLGLLDFQVSTSEPDLRSYHYHHQGADLYFFTNESRFQPIHTRLTVRNLDPLFAYDALADQAYQLELSPTTGSTSFALDLEPYESLFVISSDSLPAALAARPRRSHAGQAVEIGGDWRVSLPIPGEPDRFQPAPQITGPGNLARPGLLPDFSGVIRYEIAFERPPSVFGSGRVLLDLGEVYETAEVYLNDRPIGVRICPPYFWELTATLQEGTNRLQVDVTNTLAKQLGSQNVFDRSMAQEPSGLLGPVRLLFQKE